MNPEDNGVVKNTQKPYTVLVVEDDDSVSHLLQKVLKKQGYSTLGASSGSEAIEMIINNPEVLVLLDYILPDMNGQDVLKTISEKGLTTPFIVMTGYGDEKIAVEMMKLSAQDYMIKDTEFLNQIPLKINQIIEHLETKENLANAEKDLREKQHLNELLLDSLPHPAMLVNNRRIVLAANKIARDVGTTVDDYCWKTFGQSKYLSEENQKRAKNDPHAEGIKCYFCQAEESLSSLKPCNDPEVHAFGRLWDTYWDPLDEEMFLHYAIDVTERRHVEEKIHKQQEELQIILDSVPALVFYKDKKDRFIRVNEALVQVFDRSKEEIVGKTAAELSPGKDYWEDDKKVMETGIPLRNIIESVETPEGTKWVQTDKIPYRDSDGNIIGIIGFAVDITERKQAEETLKDTKAFLDKIIQSAPEAIITVDLNDRITSFSPSAQAMFGYKAEDIVGESVLKLYPKRQRKKRKKWKETLLKTGRLERIRTKQIKANGNTFDVSLSMALMKDSKGNPIGIVGISHDITQHLRAENELKKAYNELKELDRIKNEFLQNVSHELKTPITAMLTTTRVLKDTIQDTRVQELLEVNERSTWRLNRLVSDLLDFGRIEKNSLEMNLEMVDINDLISDALTNLQTYASNKKVTIEYNLEENIPNTMADKRSMYKVVSNLLQNAIKFNKEGGHIEVKAARKNGQLEVSIKDTGIGIDEKDHEKIFDRFYQVDGTTKRRYPGTGIGLALAKELIEMQGGKIWVESKPQEWTKFTFTHPVRMKI